MVRKHANVLFWDLMRERCWELAQTAQHPSPWLQGRPDGLSGDGYQSRPGQRRILTRPTAANTNQSDFEC